MVFNAKRHNSIPNKPRPEKWGKKHRRQSILQQKNRHNNRYRLGKKETNTRTPTSQSPQYFVETQPKKVRQSIQTSTRRTPTNTDKLREERTMPTIQTKIKKKNEKGLYLPDYFLDAIENNLQEIISHQDQSPHEFAASKKRITNKASEVLAWIDSAKTLRGK